MTVERLNTFLISAILLVTSLAGCSGLATTTPNASISADQESVTVGETVNFDARESTTPSPTIIDEYVWNFGEGDKRTTTTGITYHVFTQPGNHDVEVEVFNDRGESDRASISIFVNSPPEIILSMPGYVRTNETAVIDASQSYDSEGGSVEFIWDLDLGFDRNGDGDPTNDADETTSTVEVSYADSGNMTGSVTAIDDRGATSTMSWSIMVVKRMFNVVWEEQKIERTIDGYTEQSEYTIYEDVPSQGARLMGFNATLILDRDLLPIQWPEDNFTLRVNVPMTGWTASVQTTQGNITLNTTASIERGPLNPYPESDYTVSSDSSQTLIDSLLNEPGSRFGQGNWIWVITADQCDPDIPIDGVDPDTGNDWSLVIEYTILIPRVSEVGI
tara:strand:+ start:12749 stop:13915 length:1167 start_codon:yes stop_codon:yes gene_type:complete